MTFKQAMAWAKARSGGSLPYAERTPFTEDDAEAFSILFNYRTSALECEEAQLTLATLCDMLLGEEAQDRSNDALIRAARAVLNATTR